MFDSLKAWLTGTQNMEDPRGFMKAAFDRKKVHAAHRFGGALAKLARGLDSKCDPSGPADAVLTFALPAGKLNKVFAH
jgi:hypothetical protein